MSKDSVKSQIDSQITNKTTSKSISPLNVGSNMKAVVDLIPDITSKEDTSNKSINIVTDATSDIKYPSVKAVKTYVDANVTSSGTGVNIDTSFTVIPYISTFTVSHDKEKPNFEVHLTGNLDLTIIDTVNGDSGLVNLYFSGTEVATLNGEVGLSITGESVMVPIYFIHDGDGLKWYNDNSQTTTGGTGTVDLTDYVRISNGKNLINTNDLQRGFRYNDDGTAFINYDGYSLTDFIDVTPNTDYTMSAVYSVAYFNINKQFISISLYLDSPTSTSPSDALYAICSLDREFDKAIAQFEIGSVATTYSAFSPNLTSIIKSLNYKEYQGSIYVSGDVDVNNSRLINNIVTIDANRNLYMYPYIPAFNKKDSIEIILKAGFRVIAMPTSSDTYVNGSNVISSSDPVIYGPYSFTAPIDEDLRLRIRKTDNTHYILEKI